MSEKTQTTNTGKLVPDRKEEEKIPMNRSIQKNDPEG